MWMGHLGSLSWAGGDAHLGREQLTQGEQILRDIHASLELAKLLQEADQAITEASLTSGEGVIEGV